MGPWERRNQEIGTLREALRTSPTDLELANRYWIALAGERTKGEADLRTGSNVIEAFRAVALSSKEGVEAFAAAYRVLFEVSGEAPRSAYFDRKRQTNLILLRTRRPECIALMNGRNYCKALKTMLGQVG